MLVFTVLFYSQFLQGGWETNTVVNFPNIIAKSNGLSGCWICHRQKLWAKRHDAIRKKREIVGKEGKYYLLKGLQGRAGMELGSRVGNTFRAQNRSNWSHFFAGVKRSYCNEKYKESEDYRLELKAVIGWLLKHQFGRNLRTWVIGKFIRKLIKL